MNGEAAVYAEVQNKPKVRCGVFPPHLDDTKNSRRIEWLRRVRRLGIGLEKPFVGHLVAPSMLVLKAGFGDCRCVEMRNEMRVHTIATNRGSIRKRLRGGTPGG